MKVYVAGPMTGIPKFNFPAFDDAAQCLRTWDHWVVSPAELDAPETRAAALASPDGAADQYVEDTGETWGDMLARDVKLIADEGIEAIVVLPGWETSKGARLETFVARLSGIPIYTYDPLVGVSEPVSLHELEEAHGRLRETAGVNNSYALDRLVSFAARATADLREEFSTPFHEGETRVTDPKTGGEKGQKLAQFGSLDPLALMEVAKVAGFGAQKYARLNYTKGFDWSLAYDALMRHSHLAWSGEDVDEESGLSHWAHAAWQCLCLLTFTLRARGTDDRLHQMEWMS